MAQKKISDMTAASALAGTEIFEIVQGGNTFKCTPAQLATYVKSTLTAVTTTVDGLMLAADKVKLNGVATGANNYSHPTGDGNLHVPATGTTNNGKFLTAGATAGSLSWTTVPTATTSVAGLLSASDKTKLDGIAASANNYTLPAATTSVIGGLKVVAAVADLATPSTATAEDVANKVNALLAALRTAGHLAP